MNEEICAFRSENRSDGYNFETSNQDEETLNLLLLNALTFQKVKLNCLNLSKDTECEIVYTCA